MKNKINEFSILWHIVGQALRDEMYREDYSNINSLTMIDLSILQTIDLNPDIIFKELTALLKIPKSTLTSAVKRLEKQNYVIRTQSKEDGRVFHLSLTSKGKTAQNEHLETEYVIFKNLLSGLKEVDQDEFINLFKKALSNFKEE